MTYTVYRVERDRNQMLAVADPDGQYKAKSAAAIVDALTNGVVAHDIYVRIGTGQIWHKLKPARPRAHHGVGYAALSMKIGN